MTETECYKLSVKLLSKEFYDLPSNDSSMITIKLNFRSISKGFKSLDRQ